MVKVDRRVLEATGEELEIGAESLEGFTEGITVSMDLEIKGGVSAGAGDSIRLFFYF